MRAAFEKPCPLLMEGTAQGVAIGVSAYLPVMVTARRNEDSHRGTACGNCRSVGIAAGPRRDPPPRQKLDRSRFRQLAQRLQEACHLGRLCGVGRRRQNQENPGTIGPQRGPEPPSKSPHLLQTTRFSDPCGARKRSRFIGRFGVYTPRPIGSIGFQRQFATKGFQRDEQDPGVTAPHRRTFT